MGKASRTKAERRQTEQAQQSKFQREVDRRRAQMDAMTEEEKAAEKARIAELEIEAEQVLADFVGRAQSMKDGKVHDAPPGGNDDISPAIEIIRGGRTIAVAFCTQVSRDDALDFMWNAIPLYSADTVNFCVDAHFTKSMTNPETGRPWAQNEMQGLCDRLGYCETGLLTDTIFCQHVERNGKEFAMNLPYHVHHSKEVDGEVVPGQVVWGEDEETRYKLVSEPGILTNRQSGLVIEAVRDAFERPVPAEDRRLNILEMAKGFGIEDPLVAETHLDIVVSKMLMKAGEGRWVIMLIAANEECAEVIARHMNHAGISIQGASDPMNEILRRVRAEEGEDPAEHLRQISERLGGVKMQPTPDGGIEVLIPRHMVPSGIDHVTQHEHD